MRLVELLQETNRDGMDWYRDRVISDMVARLQRKHPDDKKSVAQLTSMAPDLMQNYWSTVLWPRIVSDGWDYPRPGELHYFDMIDDLLSLMKQQPIVR
jgi:hypothetical protein